MTHFVKMPVQPVACYRFGSDRGDERDFVVLVVKNDIDCKPSMYFVSFFARDENDNLLFIGDPDTTFGVEVPNELQIIELLTKFVRRYRRTEEAKP